MIIGIVSVLALASIHLLRSASLSVSLPHCLPQTITQSKWCQETINKDSPLRDGPPLHLDRAPLDDHRSLHAFLQLLRRPGCVQHQLIRVLDDRAQPASHGAPACNPRGAHDQRAFRFLPSTLQCMLTSVHRKMFVGDVIVWWRAMAVWPGQKLVRCFCGICLLVATLGAPLPPSYPASSPC